MNTENIFLNIILFKFRFVLPLRRHEGKNYLYHNVIDENIFTSFLLSPAKKKKNKETRGLGEKLAN